MKIKYLKEFIVLAQTGSFLEAADALSCSQSTLSKHIMRIESEMGVNLFDRSNRKVTLSKFGQLLLPDAKQIVALQEEYTIALQNGNEPTGEILAIGTIHALAQYKITDIIANFRKDLPRTTINVVQGGSEEMKEMLRQKKCEIAFIRYCDEMDDEFVKIPYAIDNMVAVLPVNHPCAGQKKVNLRMLADEDFLFVGKQTMLYRLSISACEQCGFTPKIAYTDHNVGDLCELVGKGMGVALLMKQLALYSSNPKTSIVEITPLVSTKINLCYSKDIDLSTAAKFFIKCAESQKTIQSGLSSHKIT
jgi:LysR family transcriptional regulator, transcription activator of glutamate synthase operon